MSMEQRQRAKLYVVSSVEPASSVVEQDRRTDLRNALDKDDELSLYIQAEVDECASQFEIPKNDIHISYNGRTMNIQYRDIVVSMDRLNTSQKNETDKQLFRRTLEAFQEALINR